MIILDSLHEDYEYYKITYIKIDNRYNNSYTDLRITKKEYFRFCLADLLPNLKKIINLDTDIILIINIYYMNSKI
jgi:lipopolysaccharide biosynthesis glycosyltransferase